MAESLGADERHLRSFADALSRLQGLLDVDVAVVAATIASGDLEAYVELDPEGSDGLVITGIVNTRE